MTQEEIDGAVADTILEASERLREQHSLGIALDLVDCLAAYMDDRGLERIVGLRFTASRPSDSNFKVIGYFRNGGNE